MILPSPQANSSNNPHDIKKILRKRKRNHQNKVKNVNNDNIVVNLMKKFDDVVKKIDNITTTKTMNNAINQNSMFHNDNNITNSNNKNITCNKKQVFINIGNKNLVKFHRYFCVKFGKKLKKNFTKSLIIVMIKKFLILSMNSD